MKSRPILTYSALAYGITWLLVLPLVLQGLGRVGPGISPLWHGVGALGPLLAAFLMRRSSDRSTRLGDLYRREGPEGASLPWAAFFVLSPLALFGITILGVSTLAGTLDFQRLGDALLRPEWIANLFVGSVLYGLGEEPGWRGWLLPRLQSARGSVKGSLVLAAIWGGWHLPFFTYRYAFEGPGMILGFFIGLLAGAFWLTFLYNSTGGSVWTVALWHVTWNVVNLMAAEISEPIVSTLNALMMIIGFGVVGLWGRRSLTAHLPGGSA